MPRTIGHPKKGKPSKKKQQADFIRWLEEYASVSRAAKKAKVPRSNIYEWLKVDPEFKTKFDEACELAIAALEDEAVRRAHEGTMKPIYQQGKKVGSVREYSDTLLIVLLKARAPQKYKDRFAGELTGKDGAPLSMMPAPQIKVYNVGPPLAGSEDEIKD